ncbi:MAG: 16S rRNA (guanine(527)-N(7))-methyltransferase RsmG [Pigmentiphaga sp.]|nr:16S rRNA (guanine(527)-N(7))-methyltransferase RsmG [Pigmentiphaga sp.]
MSNSMSVWEANLQADAAAMGVVVSDAALQQMRQYLEQLHRWNRTYNLTAVRDFEEMRVQHLLDSLSILPVLEREAARWAASATGSEQAAGATGSIRILDVGSGGGLPGVVIAIQKPDWQVTCVDAVAKKTAFIQQMAGVLRLPGLAARHARIEQLPPQGSHLIVSRAFASLTDFVQLVKQHLAPGGRLLAMKGRYPDDELADLARVAPDWRVESSETLEVAGLDAQRCVLVLAPASTDSAVDNTVASPDSSDRN